MTSPDWPLRYPHVFPEWPLALGFSASPGWYPLLHTLCARLETHAQRLYGYAPAFKVVQVKQKLGGLRFYAMYESDAMRQLIQEAEAQSLTVCEACGGPAKVCTINSSRVTLCETHFAQAQHQGPRKVIWRE